jgi:hypothetical protein
VAAKTSTGNTQKRDLERTRLVAAWTGFYGRPPPKGTGIRILTLAEAYHRQAAEAGGIKAATMRALNSIVKGSKNQPPQNNEHHHLSPGTRLMRDWHGETHVADILDGGVLYRGTSYRSLSAVARAITGARWSGPRFFGL